MPFVFKLQGDETADSLVFSPVFFFFNFDRESCCGDVPTKLSVFSGYLAGFQMLGGMKMEVAIKAVEGLPSGKHTKSYGKSPS